MSLSPSFLERYWFKDYFLRFVQILMLTGRVCHTASWPLYKGLIGRLYTLEMGRQLSSSCGFMSVKSHFLDRLFLYRMEFWEA